MRLSGSGEVVRIKGGVRLFIDDNVTLIEFTDTGNGVIHIRMEKAK